METVRFLDKNISPSKIICVGRNYVAHAEELGNAIPTEPVIFIKPNSAIADVLTSGVSPKSHASDKEMSITLEGINHYESELSFIIKDGCLSGVGFGFDLTKREIQKRLKEKSLPWERAKAFDGSAIFSDFVPIKEPDITQLSITLSINNKITQEGDVSLMLFKPQAILNDIKTFLTLADGDIIMTGTPKGVGPVNKGDSYTGSVYLSGHLLIQKMWSAI